jgi:hypothetical protein
MPNTGTGGASRDAALGGAALMLGIALAVWARPKLVAMLAGPGLIEQERIDRAWTILGWSDPWDEHLRRRPGDRHE